MYRSRPVVLVIFAAAAACSTRGDSASVAGLANDTTLARFSLDQRAQPLPATCGTIATPAKSGVVDKSRAAALARQAYASELVGHVRDARALLSRALELDGTSQSVAYHLGRASETLGDRDGAMTAYCRYLSLTPVASGATDVRLRLTRLSQASTSSSSTTVATAFPSHASVVTSAPIRVASQPRVHETPRAVMAAGSVPRRSGPSAGVGRATNDAGDENGSVYHRASDGDVVVAASPPASETPQPATMPSTRRRGLTPVQGAGVGAVAGAILGAATGHTVKSAVIGAAAGGILGTVVAGGSR